MSEEQIKEALEQEELPSTELEQKETQEFEYTNEDYGDLDLTSAEKQAWPTGWRPEDMFEGKSGNWKTAESYILYGEMQEQIRGVKAEASRKGAEHEASIIRLNQLHEARQKSAIDDLKAQQRQAVEEANTEEFDRLQGQIEAHQTTDAIPEVEPAKDPVIQAWEDKNPWINNPDDEKAQQAQALWSVAAAKPGATAQSALDYVDINLAKLYPTETPTNPRREMPTMTEQSARPSGRRGRSKELTMDDLTASERNEWQQFGSIMFTDEKQFLKTVADARKEK